MALSRSSPFSLRPDGQQTGDVGDQARQIEVLVQELELARLDLGEVEDVVEDRQQRLRRESRIVAT